jgi:hypothetical protein
MSNVETLFGVASMPDGHVPEDVLEMATDLLARVQRGEVQGLCIVTVDPARAVEWRRAVGTAPHNLLMAGSSYLQNRMASWSGNDD